MKRSILNLLLFNVGWFACVLGAGNAMPWLGPLVVAVLATLHLCVLAPGRGGLLLLLTALSVGYLADLMVVLLGYMGFPEHAVLGRPVPVWMPMMWVNFATTLHLSMRWILGRWVIGAVFGAVGGPLAYFTGMRLGAVELNQPLWQSMLAVGIEWAVAMPVLMLAARRLDPSRRADATKAASTLGASS